MVIAQNKMMFTIISAALLAPMVALGANTKSAANSRYSDPNSIRSSLSAANTRPRLARVPGRRYAQTTTTPLSPDSAGLVVTSADQPDTEQRKVWSNDTTMSIFGQGLEDRVESTRAAGFGIVSDFKYEPEEWLTADVRLLALAQTGAAHGLSSPTIPKNFFYPLNATLELKPSKYFAIQGGTVGQTQFNNPLLMDIYSFPGLAEKIYGWNDSVTRIWFQANQSVPMSTSMTNTSSANEPLPTLFSHTLQVQYTPDRLTKFKFSGGHWVFRDLSSQMAQDSYAFGNTVDGTQYPNFRYRYGFQGITASSSLEGQIARGIIPKVGGTYLVNTEAPSGKNMAYSVYGYTKFMTTPTWSISPGAEWYVAESDASPAIYTLSAFDFNTTGYGHNNRQGYSLELKTTYEAKKISLKGRYTDSRLLVANPQQADTKVIFIGLEIAEVSLF